MLCAVQALLERVRSFHSSRSLTTVGASGQSMVSRSGRRLTQSGVLSGLTIHEGSDEQSLPTSSTAAKNQHAEEEEEEYLIRCHNLDEFEDSEIPAICLRHRGKGVTTASDAADVVAETTTESQVVDQQTVSQPTTSSAVAGCQADCKTVVEAGERQDSRPPETGLDRHGVQGPGPKLRDKRRVSVVETPQTNYFARYRKPTLPADNLTADMTLLTITDTDEFVPLSESAIRASDVVTVDILERVINDDLRQLSANCSESLCVFAALIVSRVLDSARNKVMRENRMPPAATWREKARREAFLLVEDVLSSAAIYVSRGGAEYTRPANATSTEAISSTDDNSWVASTDDEQSLHDQLPQQQLQKVWAKQDDRQDDNKNADEKSSKPVSMPSMATQSSLTAGVSIIGSSHYGLDDVPKHEPERALKTDPSADDSVSLAHLSIIQQSQISQISRDFRIRSDARIAPKQETAAPSILKTSVAREAAAVSGSNIDAGDDPVSWQQLFSKSRQSSILSNVSKEGYRQDIATLRNIVSGSHDDAGDPSM